MTELQLLKKLQIGICYINGCFKEINNYSSCPENKLCHHHQLEWGQEDRDEFIRRKNNA